MVPPLVLLWLQGVAGSTVGTGPVVVWHPVGPQSVVVSGTAHVAGVQGVGSTVSACGIDGSIPQVWGVHGVGSTTGTVGGLGGHVASQALAQAGVASASAAIALALAMRAR